MFQTRVVKKNLKKTHFMFDNFFRKLCCLEDSVEKYCTAGQGTD